MRWLAAHRVLAVVYGCGFLLAAYEFGHPEIQFDTAEDPRWFLEPERNIADVSAALYPDRAATLYYRAYQASLCQGTPREQRDACIERGTVTPGEIRELLEQALGTGNRSIELAMYNYAMVLLQERAPDEEIDAAIRTWRVSYPRSSRPDPRTAYLEMQRRPARRDVP